MTIGIALVVPDGIALSADTQNTWNRTIHRAKAKGSGQEFDLEAPIQQTVGWSAGARKLFPFKYGRYTGAVLTAGMASIGNLTTRSMFKKLEQGCVKIHRCQDVVQYLIKGTQDELRAALGVAELSKAPSSSLEFVFAGFEDGDVTKPYVSSHIVFAGTLALDGKPNTSGYHQRWTNVSADRHDRYGACWIGRTEFVAHLVNHNNASLPPISGQYGIMTLDDAVSYTKFLAEFVCDFQRFAIMVPDCAKPVTSAVLTPDGFTFVANAPTFI